jgi:hypothetical protein
MVDTVVVMNMVDMVKQGDLVVMVGMLDMLDNEDMLENFYMVENVDGIVVAMVKISP